MICPDFKKAVLCLAAVLFAFLVRGQQSYFIYLQTDSGDPFYVKIKNKVTPSSAAGYLIIPHVSEDRQRLTVGFPANEFPEQTFDIRVDKKNQGFVIKKFNNTGWKLFNLQTLALTDADSSKEVVNATPAAIPAGDSVSAMAKGDAFASMLVNVVKDSSILADHGQAPGVIPQADTNTTAAIAYQGKADTLQKQDTDILLYYKPDKDTAIAAAPVQAGDTAVRNASTDEINKMMTLTDTSGAQMVYRVHSETGEDTVRAFFPGQKDSTITVEKAVADSVGSISVDKTAQPDTVLQDTSGFTITPTPVDVIKEDTRISDAAEPPVIKADTVAVKNDSLHREEYKVLEDGTQVFRINSGDTAKKTESQSPQKQEKAEKKNKENGIEIMPRVVTSSRVNSDCKDFATDQDFLRLRKKMAAEDSPDAMLKVAEKYFKLKCYSTEQIRNLSYLFLTDEGRYRFFDAAYPFASDSDQYEMLQSQLTDEYYLNRFRAMIRK